MADKIKSGFKQILVLTGCVALILGVGACIAVGAYSLGKEPDKHEQYLVEMDAMLTEQFPEYTFTDKMVEDLSCYKQHAVKGTAYRVCYEPQSEGSKQYGEAEVMKKDTGELVLVRLAATEEGPVLLSYSE